MPADQFSFPPLQGFSTEKEIQISSLFKYFLNLIHEKRTDVCRFWLCLAQEETSVRQRRTLLNCDSYKAAVTESVVKYIKL